MVDLSFFDIDMYVYIYIYIYIMFSRGILSIIFDILTKNTKKVGRVKGK